MHTNIKIIGFGGMGANVLISMKKDGIIADSFLIYSECPAFIKQQLDTYESINSLDFGKIGSADLLVIVTGLSGNICTQYIPPPMIQHAIKSYKDVVLVGVMPFDFGALTENANENYLVIKEFPAKRHILRIPKLLKEKFFDDLSITEAFNLVNDRIVELIKKEIMS